MDFEDGTEILSKLGILHSTEACPKKESTKSAYVEVHTTITSANDPREEVTPVTELKYRCNFVLFLFQFLSFFVTGFSLFDQQHQVFKYHRIIGSLAFIGGILAARKCTHFLRIGSFGLIVSLMLLIISLGNLVTTSVRFSPVILFVEILTCGILTYVSLAFWFIYSRSHLVKIVFISFAVYAGALAQAIILQGVGDEQLRSSPVTIDLPTSNETSRKPEIAQGIASIETKTNENEIMREHLSASPAVISAGSTVSSVPVSETLMANSSVNSAVMFLVFKAIVVWFIFILLLLLMCRGRLANLPQQLSLFKDANGTCPSVGLRVRYAAYMFLLQLSLVFSVHLFASSGNSLLTVYTSLALGSLFPVIMSCSKWAYSHVIKFVMVVYLLATCYTLVFNSYGFGVIILLFFLGSQSLFALLHVETAVKPRMSLSLDIFLISCACGSSTGWLLVMFLGVSKITCALLAFSVLIVFVLLQRSIARKTRFDEILQYKSGFDSSGDYVALLEQDFSSDSESVSFEEF